MQQEKRVLYVGFDASQYSNGQFIHSNNHLNEICVGVFSTLSEDKEYRKFSHNRDIKELTLLNSNYRNSFSLTINKDPKQDFSYNLVYSAPRLLNHFLESMPLYEFDRIELHFDGNLGKKERNFLRDELKGFASEMIIKNYVKYFDQSKQPPNRRINGKNKSKYTNQPVVVGLADILSNLLFRRHSLGLLLNLGQHTQTKITLPISNGDSIVHTHLWRY